MNPQPGQPASGAAGRIAHWTQKLLDFSARNRLLNIPQKSRQTLPLQCVDVASLEDMLADGKAVSIRSAEERPDSKSLSADLPPQEVKRRLVGLYRDARRNLEESGVNTLFLAVGALQWMEPGHGASRKTYRAPVLLVPVRLQRTSMAEGVKMYALDEDTAVNATLVEFLRSQCGVAVQGIDPLPTDGYGVDVAKVLDSFRKATAGLDGWGVFEDAVLGNFSFGKFVMWKDMSARSAELVKHPLVEHLVGGGGLFDDGIEVFPPGEIAAHSNPAALYCPVAADSSQLTAVLYSERGKTFVLHGPPGTGKSQTITNIIAHNLAKGRRVLFVSEKKAALDVVKDRLEKIGLMPFCLELHSNKTEKSRFYAQLKAALEVPETAEPGEWSQVVSDLERCRGELNGYVRALHRVQANGLTAYECFASRMADGPATVKIGVKALAFTAQDVADLREAIAKLATDWRATSAESVSALAPIADYEWNPVAERETADAARRMAAAVRRNGFAFVRKDGDGRRPPLTAADMNAAAAGAEKLAARPKFLRGLFALVAGIGRRKVEAPFADELDRAGRFIGESRGVMRYRASRRVVTEKMGLALVDAVENGACPPEKAVETFDRSFAEKTLDEILAEEPALANFAGLAQDERVALYRQLDKRQTDLARKMVFAKLAASLPRRRSGPCPEGSELGMIKRECEKKSRQKAVRTLLAESRTLLPVLKPCFLMSPLSVAQYLPVDAPPFDMVVFDEASQIPVWDAIGVIARGRQLVVVGDPKQMPPTNFFQKGDVEDEDEEVDETEIADQESILDECLVAGVASTYLSWHYRSRHESLIAFSNAHYYENRLFTFPAAADSPRLGVKFMFVPDGRFEKIGAGARVNRAEAQALVDYVCEEVKKPGYKPRRVGVVTFSISQQRLIQSLIDERRAADRILEERLPEDGPDAYFVKNLENVQGDESNVILFSVGYAPDEDGRFTMNFGPLNLTGGERRLNVAVTRAKEQVVVFSSIHGSQIDLERTKAVGAGHLKAFLEYAENGTGVSASAAGGKTAGEAFGDVVAAFLQDKGFEVDRDVGCSSYRIDVAVRDPADPKRHVLGIECDGPSYAAQRTAHDREVNRAGVLKGLGWHMCRVWSMDWAYDRARAEERLLEMLDRARKGIEVPPPALPAACPAPDVPQARSREPQTTYKVWKTSARYQAARLKDPDALPKLRSQLEELIAVEGPVCESVMLKRVCKVWNVSRMTEAVCKAFASALPSVGFVTTHGDRRVFWASGQKPEAYRAYRVPGNDEASHRAIEEIPPEELANAMREILADLGRCPQDVLYRETVKTFGLWTVTSKAREYLDVAYAMADGK